jgi:HK97 family phage portal protein
VKGIIPTLLNRAPVSYTSDRLNFGIFARADQGRSKQLQAMTANGTLFAIVDKSATSVSSIEWGLYRKARSGKPEERVQVTTHPALELWQSPNDFMTRQELVEASQQYFELTGEIWWLVGRDPRSSMPLELWPADPSRMEPVPSAENFLAGYTYHGPDGEDVPLGLDEVIFIRRPRPGDPYRGISPVEAMLLDIGADRAAAEWNAAFFRNSAEPGGIIQIERKLTDAEFRQHQLRWREQHQGTSAAHRVALLEGGMQWVDRKMTMRDMEFSSLRALSGEKIREATGFPKPLLGSVDDVNRANAEAAEYVFGKWWVVPRCDRLKGALNVDLLTKLFLAPDLEFDYETPVDEDGEHANAERDSKVKAAIDLINAGVDPVEAFEAFELPAFTMAPTEDGAPTGIDAQGMAELIQKIYLGVNTVVTWDEARQVLSDAGVPVDLALPPPEPEQTGAPGEAAPTGEEPTPAAPGRRGPAPEQLRRPPQRAKVRPPSRLMASADGEREDWEERLDDLLATWAEDVTPAQVDDLVGQVKQIVTNGAPTQLIQLSTSSDDGAQLLTDAMFAQADAAGRRTAADAAVQGVTISPVTPIDPGTSNRARNGRAAKFIEGLAADLRNSASVSTAYLAQSFAQSAGREALRNWSPGSTAEEVGEAVQEHLESLTQSTLKDELGAQIWAAENEGRSATFEEAEKEDKRPAHYVADEVRDANTCKPCRDIDGSEFATLEAATKQYPFGGFRRCEGRSRCRGTYWAQWS